ncbi:hypothetical protein [Streptomyces sp. ERV7]|uniref:hypothetical protein n=1 Tax=Streptomyces sp. ERV7 TaxID=1322334 RepID=UPI000AC791E9|nr:hypothetical protein [Streptomyces sp. ERV7]
MDDQEEEDFAFFLLTGDRFDPPGMPADTAREVGTFREAVLKVARHLWLEENPDRRRLPNGFNEAFDLRLLSISGGSAKPRMRIYRQPGRVSDADWSEWSSIYTKARDVLTDSLQGITEPRQQAIQFPPDTLGAIRRVGSSLRDSETLVLGDPRQESKRAIVDHTVRELLDEIEEIAPTPELAHAEGLVIEYDGSTLSFRLKTDTGTITCRLDPKSYRLASAAKDFLATDGITAPDVRVSGETLDPTQRNAPMVRITEIVAIRSVEEKALHAQLHRIHELHDGWLGPGSKAPDGEVMGKAARLIPEIARLGAGVSLVPSTEGAILLEWQRGEVEMSAAIEPDDEMFLCADNTATDDLLEDQSAFDESRLLSFLTDGSMQ